MFTPTMRSFGYRKWKDAFRSTFARLCVLTFLFGIPQTTGLIQTGRLAAETETEARERSEAFAWFETLGYPDVKEARFVRVIDGKWSKFRLNQSDHLDQSGYIVSEKGDQFTVFFADLTTQTLTKSPPGTEVNQRVDFEAQNLHDFAVDLLIEARAAQRQPNLIPPRRELSERAALFALAWACSQKGDEQTAAELYHQSVAMPDAERNNGQQLTFRQALANDIAHAEMERAIRKFEDITVPRERLLRVFERIVRNFPGSEDFVEARELVTLLQKMVLEDRKHAAQRKVGRPFEELSQDEQIAELIFLLRDQHEPFRMPDDSDANVPTKEDPPTVRLFKLGYHAVPQLIEALDDERLTRCLGWHHYDYSTVHRVLRVSSFAHIILSSISGRTFQQESQNEDRKRSIKQEASAWYAEIQKRGLREYLFDEVAVGNARSADLAARIVKEYSDAGSAALIAGARNAKQSSVRTRLVKSVSQLKGEATLAFLLDELKNGPALCSRLAAAQAIHERGRQEAVTAMIAEWLQLGETKGDVYELCIYDLIPFLAHCGKVEAIQALQHKLDVRPWWVRLQVVSAFAQPRGSPVSAIDPAIGSRPGEASNPGQLSNRVEQEKLRVAVMKLLMASLDDVDERCVTTGERNGVRYANPRICDLAADVLQNLDPTRYSFDLCDSFAHRERARLVLKNVILQEQGLPVIPIAPPRSIKSVADEMLLPILRRYETSTDETGDSAEAEIIKLGLGALPAVIRRRDIVKEMEKRNAAQKQLTIAAGDPRRVKLDKLSRQLSLLVVEVEFDKRSLQPGTELMAALMSLKEKPLEALPVQQLISTVTEKLPANSGGFRLVLDRSENGTGVTLRIDIHDLVRSKQLRSGGNQSSDGSKPTAALDPWNFYQFVCVGHTCLGSGTGQNFTRESAIDCVASPQILNPVTSADPYEDFEICIEMTSN